MSNRSARVFSLLLPVALLAAAGAAWAQHDDGGRPWRGHEPRRDDQNLADAVRRAGRENRGNQVLSAERIPFDGRDVNRIKVVDPTGRVKILMDDPQQRGRHDDRPTRRDDNDND